MELEMEQFSMPTITIEKNCLLPFSFCAKHSDNLSSPLSAHLMLFK